jgi:hypothetical protein
MDMAYMKRVVIAGLTRETKKMETLRANTKKASRCAKQSQTTERQKKINERAAEERLRWKINANFGYGDLHVVLHYGDKSRSLDQCLSDLALFKRRLHILCARRGISMKFISTTETKRMTNIHHHVILNRMDMDLIIEAWQGVPGGGWVTFQPLDRRGNHGKLAHYLMKESKSTLARVAEAGRKIKRFSCSRGLVIPKPVYEKVAASSWLEEPRASKGWFFWKDDNGDAVRSGMHETGYPWQEYVEIRTVLMQHRNDYKSRSSA